MFVYNIIEIGNYRGNIMENKNRVIFHVDVNSAFLSWEAAYRMHLGSSIDLREIPSVVGGDVESRHGIVLAKSMPAKECGIKTGETLYKAREKCPELVIVPPNFQLYIMYSDELIEILKEYTPDIQKFSVDECFLDFTGMEHMYKDPVALAYEIKGRIKKELGFTVNIGISNNKLLAKIASDLKKPDMVHTLYPSQIEEKMWPLPVEALFMVGKATAPKLHRLNINTIGDLARYDRNILKQKFKSFGTMIWSFANGIENSQVRSDSHIDVKCIGNSTTQPFDVKDMETARKVLLFLCETVCLRLRNSKNLCSLVAVSMRNSEFINYSRQRKLDYYTDSTIKVWNIACELFKEGWKGDAIRNMGVRVSKLCSNDFMQISMFDDRNVEKMRALDKTIDNIRMKYGSYAIVRCSFLNSGLNAINGGYRL